MGEPAAGPSKNTWIFWKAWNESTTVARSRPQIGLKLHQTEKVVEMTKNHGSRLSFKESESVDSNQKKKRSKIDMTQPEAHTQHNRLPRNPLNSSRYNEASYLDYSITCDQSKGNKTVHFCHDNLAISWGKREQIYCRFYTHFVLHYSLTWQHDSTGPVKTLLHFYWSPPPAAAVRQHSHHSTGTALSPPFTLHAI